MILGLPRFQAQVCKNTYGLGPRSALPGVHNPEPITTDVKNIYIIPKLKMLAVDALVLEEIETR